MYNTVASTEKKLAAYRISPLTIERLRAKAKSDNVSVNALVERVLTDFVKDVRSEAELEEERKATSRFIGEFAGIWSGQEYEKIEEEIYSTRTIKAHVEL